MIDKVKVNNNSKAYLKLSHINKNVAANEISFNSNTFKSCLMKENQFAYAFSFNKVLENPILSYLFQS
jgi:hypothetical protein